MNPVVSVDLSGDGCFILGGYLNGRVDLWEIN
jgi:hypothetical protein